MLEHSSAGWSEDGAPTAAQGSPEDRRQDGRPSTDSAEPEARYANEGMLGEGGMGVVECVLDRRLDRRVARKQTRHPDAGLEARLRREIEVLASLQHPSIVPLLDACTDPARRPWYTMPRIRGDTLEQAFATATTAAQRMSLLRPVLAVCQAVAYAHDEGLIHRDLKPANVILGAKGEVFVLDWGLARRVLERDAPVPSARTAATSNTNPGLTVVGQQMGTPRYMSPELRRGEPAQKASDVFALGVILFFVAFGRQLAEGDDASALVSLKVPAQVPLALLAVVRKCLRPAQADRYADAGALSQDLERLIDGQRVAAHAYSSWELIRRFVGRNRRAVAVASLSALAVAGLAWASISQIRSESEQRLQAQVETRAALARVDARLHVALVGQAIAAMRVGADPEAERFALEALAMADSPRARGVLAALPLAHVTREPGPALPSCERASFFPNAAGVACVVGHKLSIHNFSEATPVYEATLAGDRFVVLDARHFALATNDGGTEVHNWVSGAPPQKFKSGLGGLRSAAVRDGGVVWSVGEGWMGSWRAGQPPVTTPLSSWTEFCPDSAVGQIVSSTNEPDTIWGYCLNGTLFKLGMREGSGELLASTQLDMMVSTLAIGRGPSAGLVFLGGADGEVQRRDAQTLAPLEPLLTPLGRLRVIDIHPEGRLLALRDDAGHVELVHFENNDLRLRFPGSSAQALQFDPQGRLSVATARMERWTIHAPIPVRKRSLEAGVSSVAISHDDRHVVATDGAGNVVLWDAESPNARWQTKWQARVAKDCAFAAHSTRLACVAMRGGARVWDTPNSAPRLVGPDDGYYRRAAWLGDDLWLFGYGNAPKIISADGDLREAVGGAGDWKDVGSSPDRSSFVRLNRGDGSLRVERNDIAGKASSHIVALRPDALAVDLGPSEELAVVGPAAQLEVLEANGSTRFKLDAASARRLLDVEISPDGQLIAAGTLGGEILLWDRSGRLRARLEGHRQRVVKLAFSADGSFLVSASWDKTVRRWELAAVATPDTTQLASQWDVSLTDATRAMGH